MSIEAVGSMENILEELDLRDLLRKKSLSETLKEDGQPSLEPRGDQVSISRESLASLAQNRGDNLMNDNFASFGNKEDSRYIKAQKAGRQAAQAISGQMLGMVEGMLVSPRQYATDRYGEAATPAQAQMAMKRARDKEVYEYSEEQLKASREELETAVEELMAPTDANGNPIPLPGDSGSAQALPDTDISIRQIAPEPAAAAQALPDMAIQTEQTVSQAKPVSINIHI